MAPIVSTTRAILLFKRLPNLSPVAHQLPMMPSMSSTPWCLLGTRMGQNALVKAASLLKKTYFSGGTVSASIADIDFVQRRETIEQVLEDGTISFLSIASLRHGFKMINTLSSSAIARHTASLATYMRKKMLDLKHGNGKNVCIIYGQQASEVVDLKLGPTISFNLKREDGSWFGYCEVEKLASLSRIHLRTGCFCNTGACAKHLGLSHLDLVSNFEWIPLGGFMMIVLLLVVFD